VEWPLTDRIHDTWIKRQEHALPCEHIVMRREVYNQLKGEVALASYGYSPGNATADTIFGMNIIIRDELTAFEFLIFSEWDLREFDEKLSAFNSDDPYFWWLSWRDYGEPDTSH
jgi:hypothetical protein